MSAGLLILSDLVVTPAESVLLVPALTGDATAGAATGATRALAPVDAACVARALVVALLALEATQALGIGAVTVRRWLGMRRTREATVRAAPASRLAHWPAGAPETALLHALRTGAARPLTRASTAPELLARTIPRADDPVASWIAARFAALAERGLLESAGHDVARRAVWCAAPGTHERARTAHDTATTLLDRCRATRPLVATLLADGAAAALGRGARAAT